MNLPLLYVLWLEEYCQTSPNKNKTPNLWHLTSILVCCIFDPLFRADPWSIYDLKWQDTRCTLKKVYRLDCQFCHLSQQYFGDYLALVLNWIIYIFWYLKDFERISSYKNLVIWQIIWLNWLSRQFLESILIGR